MNIIDTNDGSNSIYSDLFKATYHSVHGAIQETEHVFIDAGLKNIAPKEEVNILEVGFGTGLNVFMTYLAFQDKYKINLTSFETNPIEMSIVKKLNYPSLLEVEDKTSFFEEMHSCPWNTKNILSPYFSLTKKLDKFENSSYLDHFHLVYYDAFGPGTQPELWEYEVLSKVVNSMKIEGVFVTYCAKGSVKRALKSLGMELQTLDGPPGKREMIRAIKL